MNENEDKCKLFFNQKLIPTPKLSNFISNIIFASVFLNSSILMYSFVFL